MSKTLRISLLNIGGVYNHSIMTLLVERINSSAWITADDLRSETDLIKWYGDGVSEEVPGLDAITLPSWFKKTTTSLVESLTEHLDPTLGRVRLQFMPEIDSIILVQWGPNNATDKT